MGIPLAEGSAYDGLGTDGGPGDHVSGTQTSQGVCGDHGGGDSEGATGRERIYDGYPDVALDMTDSRTFDGQIQLVEYVPRVLDGPPGMS